MPHSLVTQEIVERETDPSGTQSETIAIKNTENFLVPLNADVKETKKQVLKAASEEQAKLRSVEVKMLDFDWIFQNDNAKTFLGMLAITDYEYLFSTG